MGYTIKDVPYYVGFLVGTLVMYFVLVAVGVESQLVRAVIAMLGGAGVEYGAERMFMGKRDKQKDGGEKRRDT